MIKNTKRSDPARFSLFWRYFILLVTITVISWVALLVSARMYTKTLRETYLTQVENTFRFEAASFSSDLRVLYSLPSILENSQYYSYISYYKETLPENRYFALRTLRNTFFKQTTLLRIQKEGFFVLTGSYAGSTHTRSFPNMENCFSSYMQFSEISTEELRELLTGLDGLRILPTQNVLVGAQQNEYLTVLVGSTRTGSQLVVGTLYPASSVLECFGISALPSDSFLTIVSSDDTQLLAYNEPADGSGFYIFEEPLTSIGARVTIGIPKEYIENLTQPITRRMTVLMGVLMLLGIALCFLFSSLSVQPLRRLVKDYSPSGSAKKDSSNELHVLTSYLDEASLRDKQMNALLFSSLLERTFLRQPLAENELSSLSAMFPVFAGTLSCAVIRDNAGDAEGTLSEYLGSASDPLPSDFSLTVINTKEMGILCPSDAAHLNTLTQFVFLLNEESDAEVRFVAGISRPFSGLSSFSAAVTEAYSAIPTQEGIMVLTYSEEPLRKGDSSACVSLTDLERFSRALSERDTVLAEELLSEFEKSAVRLQDPVELLHSLTYILRNRMYEEGISFAPYENRIHPRSLSVQENFTVLRDMLTGLKETNLRRKDADRKMLSQELVRFVSESYNDPNLCADTVASEYGVSVHFVHSAFSANTGKSFNSFLQDTRMKAAADLLRSSDERIESIAALCGYAAQSTFYRVFKQYYDITPRQYRAKYKVQ